MTVKDEVREFLISRRAHVTPEMAGLKDGGGERRVPGLRRGEVAELAGVSLDYYNRLERGNIRGASDSVLHAVARALQLSAVEREHLFDLARGHGRESRAAEQEPASNRSGPLRESVQRVLDNLTLPAIVWNASQDLLSANPVGRQMFAPHFESPHPNMARFIFLDPRARVFYTDWALARTMTAAMLRREAGRDPLNEDLTSLIGELSIQSSSFRHDWANRDVHEHSTGAKVFEHPEVGTLEVTFDVFEMPGQAGLFITTYGARAGSPSADRLQLLSVLAAQ